MKRIGLVFAVLFSLEIITAEPVGNVLVEQESQLQQVVLAVGEEFLGFPIQKINHEYFQEKLHKTRIYFNYPETKPYEITAAFTEAFECQLDEMNSTDFMVCYKLADGNLAIFSLGVNFTLEIIFSETDSEKYHRTKPLID